MVNTDGPARNVRPPTVTSRSLPPSRAARSSRVTWTPARCRWMAAAKPPTPPPMTVARFTLPLYYTKMRDEHGGHRHIRLQQILEEELQSLVRDELTDPRLDGLRVSAVELSVDFRSARVKFVTENEDETAQALEKIDRALVKATRFLRARLSETMEMKRLPELHFVYDRD